MASDNRKRRRYTVEEKLEIVAAARATSITEARARYGVSRSSVHEWQQTEEALAASHPTARRSQSLRQVHEPSLTNNAQSETSSTAFATRSVDGEGHSEANAHGGCHYADSVETSQRHRQPSRPLLIGYQGEDRGFPEMAARRAFADLIGGGEESTPRFELTGYPHMIQTLDAVEKREIDYAFVSCADLLSSTAHLALDHFVSLRLRIVGEVEADERMSVCAFPGTRLSDTDCVMSDWRVLSQHEGFIIELEKKLKLTLHRQVVWDSATGCRIVQEEKAKSILVLCSSEAARAHGLAVLIDGDISTTRSSSYFVLARRGRSTLAFDNIGAGEHERVTTRLGTVLLDSTDPAAFFRVVTAFSHLSLQIKYLCSQESGSSRSNHRCIISYYASADARVESTLDMYLSAAAQRVEHLGCYFKHKVVESLIEM